MNKALLQGMFEHATPYDYCTAVKEEWNHDAYYENMDNMYIKPSDTIESIYENFEHKVLYSENIRYKYSYNYT